MSTEHRPPPYPSEVADHDAYLVAEISKAADDHERRDPGPKTVERFVLEEGRKYARPPQSHKPLMSPNRCFENSMLFADQKGVIYVEGFVLVATPRLWTMDHGWCADSTGNVCEVTLERPAYAYFGVAFAPGYITRRCANERERRHGNGSLLRSNGREPLLYGLEQDWRA